ncbi:MAG: hypothetical protein H0T68_01260 [Gemmatimonadales bacterium]|nr:hypothetical protein [Gemmatimonadales bacterium]
MHGHRMCADHQEPRARLGQRAEHVGPVVAHAGRKTRPGMPGREYDGAGRPVSSHMRRLSSATIARRSSGVETADKSSPGSSPRR